VEEVHGDEVQVEAVHGNEVQAEAVHEAEVPFLPSSDCELMPDFQSPFQSSGFEFLTTV
jgi:hypothetical protein